MNEVACYIHVPFCASKCPYCDFYSLESADIHTMEKYAARCAELLRGAARYRWKTLYLGGGSPSVLSPALLGEILAGAGERLLPGAEVTAECNPASTTPALCEVLAAHGVNRISMGLQSILPEERAVLGRKAGPEQIYAALDCVRAAGIKNVSLDVMLGVPHQSIESLEETLQFCLEAGVQHVSAYLLSIEEGTAFGKRMPKHLPDEDAQAALYLRCCEWLETHGYRQYEISNFARPGYESRHNLAYWRCEEYFAAGPSAHGYTNGRRWHYPRDLAYFLYGGAPVDDGPGGEFEERAMLALRLKEGVLSPPARLMERAAKFPGLVICDAQGLRLTREGFLVSNAVIAGLLST